jgi:methionine sulfoxide reductase heme-binding subunit
VAHSLGEGTDAGEAWFLIATSIVVLPAAALLVARMSGRRAAPQAVAR